MNQAIGLIFRLTDRNQKTILNLVNQAPSDWQQAAGQGVAIMPNEAAALPHPQVVFMPLHQPICYARSTAMWRKETPTKSLDKFLNILLKEEEV